MLELCAERAICPRPPLQNTTFFFFFKKDHYDDLALGICQTFIYLSFQGKQLFVAKDKIQAFKGKLEFWKTGIHCCCELNYFLILKTFLMILVVMLMNVLFKNII